MQVNNRTVRFQPGLLDQLEKLAAKKNVGNDGPTITINYLVNKAVSKLLEKGQ